MNTCSEVYGSQVACAASTPPKSTGSPGRKWLHENPSVSKAAIASMALWGIGTALKGIVNYSISRAAFGAVAFAGSLLLEKTFPFFIPPTHDPHNKAFIPSSCKGVSLTYEGNLPILIIPKNISPFDAGYARGYMMAAQIKELIGKNEIAFFFRWLPNKIPFLTEKMKQVIPSIYIEEMKGIAAGYNSKRETWKFLKGKELTLDALIYFHLVPEIGHLDFKEANNWSQRYQADFMGCSVVIDGDAATGPKAIRTVDWIPMDVYGKYAFAELRETEEGVRIAGQSFPLFAGCLTAMNEHGLCVALNAARGITDYPVNMPAVFYLRQMIETCNAIKGDEGAENFWKTRSPLGAFNLSILDPDHAAGVHFYQGFDDTPYERWWQPDSQLITLNFRYGELGETNPTPTNSAERKYEIEQYYRTLRMQQKYYNMSVESRLKPVLKGPEVNNIRTTSAAYMDPRKRMFETSFDNGYASDRPLMQIPAALWFSRKEHKYISTNP